MHAAGVLENASKRESASKLIMIFGERFIGFFVRALTCTFEFNLVQTQRYRRLSKTLALILCGGARQCSIRLKFARSKEEIDMLVRGGRGRGEVGRGVSRLFEWLANIARLSCNGGAYVSQNFDGISLFSPINSPQHPDPYM